jgi:excisionase family DNA binding protein
MTMTAATIDQRQPIADEGFADVAEAAEFLSMSRSTVYKLMDAGQLAYAKFGKSRRIPRRALREFGERSMIGQ